MPQTGLKSAGILEYTSESRSIEINVTLAGSNRTGIDGEGIGYTGESMIIDPKGDIIASAGTGKNCSVTAEISLAGLSSFRNKFFCSEGHRRFYN